MFTWCLSLILSFTFVINVSALRKQGVAIRGQLLCGSRPANETKVRIVDLDTGLYVKSFGLKCVNYESFS